MMSHESVGATVQKNVFGLVPIFSVHRGLELRLHLIRNLRTGADRRVLQNAATGRRT
jgi:hypothetical protein